LTPTNVFLTKDEKPAGRPRTIKKSSVVLYLPGGYQTSRAIWLNAPIPNGQDQITNVPERATVGLFLFAAMSLVACRSLMHQRIVAVAPRQSAAPLS
jgi:hypothetical protein